MNPQGIGKDMDEIQNGDTVGTASLHLKEEQLPSGNHKGS